MSAVEAYVDRKSQLRPWLGLQADQIYADTVQVILYDGRIIVVCLFSIRAALSDPPLPLVHTS